MATHWKNYLEKSDIPNARKIDEKGPTQGDGSVVLVSSPYNLNHTCRHAESFMDAMNLC